MAPHDTLFHDIAQRLSTEPEQAVRIQTPQGDDLIVLDRARYQDLLTQTLAWDGLARDEAPLPDPERHRKILLAAAQQVAARSVKATKVYADQR